MESKKFQVQCFIFFIYTFVVLCKSADNETATGTGVMTNNDTGKLNDSDSTVLQLNNTDTNKDNTTETQATSQPPKRQPTSPTPPPEKHPLDSGKPIVDVLKNPLLHLDLVLLVEWLRKLFLLLRCWHYL